ncbi:MAG: hypothetical protein H6721_22770 [Sandaracinus sp.]|nr:hypothetical protein [Sandaracinus sp.]MCB9634957.1 hypothetical protein [Sandaracinus sp.]
MRASIVAFLLVSLVGCGRSRVVTPLPATDGGVADAGRDGGRDAGDAGPGDFRFGIVWSDCAPDDGPAWSGVVSRTPLTCSDFRTTDEHIRLYFFGGARGDVYSWPTGAGNGTPSYCRGGAAPCAESSSGEAQLLVGEEDLPPTLRLRAEFPTFTVDTEMRVTVCFEDMPTPCG